jgi:ribosome-associated heat shock protein Hsp15
MSRVRLDKWLWAARFFKTRSMAARACELGRIQSRGQPVKPAREVQVGEMLQIRTGGGEFEVEVLQLSGIRGPAAVAKALYRETPASSEARERARAERKAMMHFNPAPAARPSKRDRRRILRFREEQDGQGET